MARKSDKSRKSPQERQAEVKALLETLKKGVTELADSEAWTNYLVFQARFHNYSFGNTLLIQLQCPGATRVAGYRAWQKLGRQVSKDEKGIRILAPNGMARFSKEVTNSAGETEDREFSFMRFKTVSVFDVSQTEGDEVPSRPDDINRLEGDDNGLIDRLVAYAVSEGVKVTFEHVEGAANGYCVPSEKRICVDSGMSKAQQAKTLAHELGHMLLHAKCADLMGRDDKELEAESVAYIVCNAMGVDSAEYSFGYIAHWAGKGADKGFKASAERIVKAAQSVIEGVNDGFITGENEKAA